MDPWNYPNLTWTQSPKEEYAAPRGYGAGDQVHVGVSPNTLLLALMSSHIFVRLLPSSVEVCSSYEHTSGIGLCLILGESPNDTK